MNFVQEISFFFSCVGISLGIWLIYDFLYCWKCVRRVKSWKIALMDIIYGIAMGIGLFVYLLEKNYGAFRSYFILGLVTGAYFYYRFLHKRMCRVWMCLMTKILMVLSIPAKKLANSIKRLKNLVNRVRILAYGKLKEHQNCGKDKGNGNE